MSTPADIAALLDRLDALDREVSAIRSAPPPLDLRLAEVRAELEASAAAFRAAPWSARVGLKGALAAVLPKQVASFEEARAREVWAADPRPPLTDIERRQRLTATEATLAEALAGLGPDDLARLEQDRDRLHAVLRGLTQRRDELQTHCDRRVQAVALLQAERESGPVTPPTPTWPGYDHNGEPQFAPAPPPRPLSRAERRGRDAAITAQLVTENVALDRLAGELAAIKVEVQQASQRWRAAAALAERCKKWLQKKPVAAVMPAAAE